MHKNKKNNLGLKFQIIFKKILFLPFKIRLEIFLIFYASQNISFQNLFYRQIILTKQFKSRILVIRINNILHFQEVLTTLYSKLLFKMSQDFLDIQEASGKQIFLNSYSKDNPPPPTPPYRWIPLPLSKILITPLWGNPGGVMK